MTVQPQRRPLRLAQPEDALSKRLEWERGLVGRAIIGEDEVRQPCGWLKPEKFHDQLLGEFWRRFVAGENALDVAIELGIIAPGKSSMVWDITYPFSYFEAPHYAKMVARSAYLEEIRPMSAKLAQATAGGDWETARDLAQQISEITPQIERTARNAMQVGATFLEVLDQPQRNVMTWVAPLDKALAGLERQTLSILAARPSMGKSSLAFQIARNVAAHGDKVLFVSLEMSETNLWARAACGAAGLTWRDVRSGNYTSEQRKFLQDMCMDLMVAYGDLLLIHDQRCSTDDIWELAAAEKPALVVVDHLRLVSDTDPNGNENQRLGDVTWRFKAMAKTLDLHAMVLAQLNRQPDNRAGKDKRPQLTDLRDSGEIEENADVVLMMYREEYYDHNQKAPGGTSETEIWVRKARDGIRDSVIKLVYDMRQQWFEGTK